MKLKVIVNRNRLLFKVIGPRSGTFHMLIVLSCDIDTAVATQLLFHSVCINFNLKNKQVKVIVINIITPYCSRNNQKIR